MGKYLNRTSNFFIDLFVNRKVPEIYSKIHYWNNDLTLYEQRKEDAIIPPRHATYSISLIPEYFNLTTTDSSLLISKTFDQTNLGYAIMLHNGFAIDTFLKNQFGSNYRNLKKRHIRLESCFDINYKIIYGIINEVEYHFLMKNLHAMLSQRFEQRGEINEKLLVWDELLATTINQINEQKASLFVIYDDDMPIDISINYHFHKIMFGAVSSYNIDYSKFGLGSIEKIKLLEWCLSNDYKILEFGYGDWEFKRAWCNYIYHFKYAVLFNPKSILSLIFAKYELFKLSFKEYLKSKKVAIYVTRIKEWRLFASKKRSFEATNYDYERTRVLNLHAFGALRNVCFKEASPYPLRLVLNDFLYTNMEHKKDVVMLEVLEQPGIFLLSGKNNIQKITFGNMGTHED